MQNNEPFQPVRISELAHEAPFPVYGLVNKPLELAICSVSWGSSNSKRTSVGFVFSSSRYPQVRENVDIGSSDAKQEGIIYKPRNNLASNPLFDFDALVFEYYRLSNEIRAQAGSPQTMETEIPIAGKSFIGEIHYWSQPYQLSRFLFSDTETVLSGFTFGPSQEELLLLLKELVVINHCDDLLAQYQDELDQETERLFSKRE